MVQPFIVAPDDESLATNDDESFTLPDNSSHGASEEIVHVREDTPPPSVQRRLFVDDGDTSATPPASQSRQHRRSGSGSRGLRSLCCGLFARRSRPHTTSPSTVAQPSTSTQPSTTMTQTRVPIAHTTIPEEDEEEQDGDQENQPPTIIETLVESHNEHAPEVQQEQEEEQAEGGASRRHSVRHSWVTVSRWLE